MAILFGALAGCAQIVGLGPERELESSSVSGAGGAGGGTGGTAGAGGEVTTPCAGGVVWARQLGDASRQVFQTAVGDGEGGVYVAGFFSGSFALGDEAMIADVGTDIFVARFDANGHHVWSRSFPDTATQGGDLHLAHARGGGVVVAGSFWGTLELGGEPLTAEEADAFAVRYDADGNHLWSRRFGGAAWQGVRALAVDQASGDVLLAGYFHQSIDFGGRLFSAPGTAADAFVAKLDATGVHQWSHAFGGPEGDYANAIAVDAAGRVAFGGSADTDIDLGDGLLMHTGDDSTEVWLALYDPGGAPVWTAMYADPGFEDLREIAFAPSQELVVSGKLRGSLDLGGDTLSTAEGVFVARLTPAGAHLASMAIGGIYDSLKLAVDAGSDVYLSGFFSSYIDPGGGPIAPAGKLDGVFVRLSPGLDYVWSLSLGSIEDDELHGIAPLAEGGAFLLGTFRDVVNVAGCGTFQSEGDADVLLLKLAP